MKNIKNKGKQILSVCLSIVILLTMFIMPVSAAEAPQTITVKRTKVMESYIGDNNGFTAYATTDNVIVYCMELIKKGATTGTNYTFLEDADAGLAYIIENGYPNKSITNRDEIDQYITQSAVWWYLDEVTGAGNLSEAFQTTDKEAYPGIRDQIKKLVNDAKSASAASEPTMTVTINNINFGLSDDEKYYESDYVTVDLNGASEYQVEINNENASAVNENGEVKTTFTADEKFKIRLDASSVTDAASLDVKVKATGTVKQVATYNPSDSSFQKVVSSEVYTKNVGLEKTLTLNVNPEKSNICKVENGKYYGKDGREVDEATYNEECTSSVVAVPDTSANVPMVAIVGGLILIVAGASLIIYRYRTNKN